MSQRAQRELQEGEFLVVAGDAIGAQDTTAGAAVDQGPLAILPDIDPDRLHSRTTTTGAVARLLIDVAGPQAERAMVAVACTK